jgi:hypothetical protein
MYPAPRGDGTCRFSEFNPVADGTPLDSDCLDLFEYAPKVEFDLHPGDVSFLPGVDLA